ncbi:M20 metallopeptidase family protein [Geofilum rubicundum]|uniref:N-acetyl-L,L-diaminopimelate deacetylase n=1 Tax=Geofilum rubicundum JCM 15548 TaxID=1236989 RepID=A0A0E9LTR9_9BACT|nr:M20 family metallopeptidase [Geofilum rubicundum]GAO28255.1 N-acetyl-L,L-diaminopimelate deacetylase [Geofilum rubicundum JCM 15548]
MHNIDRETIQKLTQEIYKDLLTYRRQLHQNPELSFEENETARYISQILRNHDIPIREGIAGTGIIATIQGERGTGRTIALRADMDALPIREATGLPFASQNNGVMHACGHDAHSASLLGTGIILNRLKKQWGGTILLIFQPGEEKFPGGASLILKEGALNHPRPDLIIGQHVLPEMASGNVGFKKGMYMASGDEVYITVNGKGGHAAMPHTLNDTILAASQVIVNLQQIVSRIVPANIPTVLSFGHIEGKGATNIIPEEVAIAGTLRTMNEDWRSRIKDKIRHIAETTAATYGCRAEVDIKDGYPMVLNNEEVTARAQELATEYLGKAHVETMETRMTAEDFGFYSQEFPATFYRFGVRQNDGETGALHTPRFNLNEKSLETSCGLMTWVALNMLQP